MHIGSFIAPTVVNYCAETQFFRFLCFFFLAISMSRTQQKLQAMSAQELLIQEKKRMIEEKLRLENSKKSKTDCKLIALSKIH